VLAKKTVKNQLTLPKRIADRFPGVDYFEVQLEQDRIVLSPVRPDRLAEVRAKLIELGVTPGDVTRAVAWARRRRT
jgi:hypothetical protein